MGRGVMFTDSSQLRGQECAVKEGRKVSGITVTKVSFQSRKTASTTSKWHGRRGFSRNFCPVDTMAKPQSLALQTLEDMFSTWAAVATRFPGNVAGCAPGSLVKGLRCTFGKIVI